MPTGEGARAKLRRFHYCNSILVQEVWFINCTKRGMLFFEGSSRSRLGRISGLTDCSCFWGRTVLVVLMIQHLAASDLFVRSQSRPESVAFARYVASLEQHDPFTEAGPVGVLIETPLPHFYKDSELLAVRRTGENERSEYLILAIGGDGAAVSEVTRRYFALREEIENLPLTSIQISPANYKFRFRGEEGAMERVL